MHDAFATDVFAEWVDLNQIMSPWRSRFDGMKDGLQKLEQAGTLTKETFSALLATEGYITRYPRIPDWIRNSK